MKQVTIWTDGSCWPNPGPGGWAAILRFGDGSVRELSGRSDGPTTNNRMELTAAIEALKSLDGPHHAYIYTDSQYLQRGAREWLAIWQRRAWRSGRKPVMNDDLWKEIQRLRAYHQTHWHWVRGHADCADNIRADKLAETARTLKTPVAEPGLPNNQ